MATDNKILDTINLLKARGIKVQQKDEAYSISGPDYSIRVLVDRGKWLSLDFSMPGTKIAYPINTDLYDLTSPDNQSFARAIEDDIVAFLLALVNGEIRVLRKGEKIKVIIPLSSETVILKSGRFFSSAKRVKSSKDIDIETDDNIEPLKPLW
jgi:hypothetical protein